MLSNEVDQFYRRWSEKAEGYQENDLRNCFDEFFTLFVAFNSLYVQASYKLISRGDAKLNKYGTVPDGEGAKENVVKYLDAQAIFDRIEAHQPAKDALNAIVNEIKSGRFYLKTAAWDTKRVAAIRSQDPARLSKATLEILYVVRCNMFHGSKGYEPIQMSLLKPCIVLLRIIKQLLYESLVADII